VMKRHHREGSTRSGPYDTRGVDYRIEDDWSGDRRSVAASAVTTSARNTDPPSARQGCR
jgi:hypothetical protein